MSHPCHKFKYALVPLLAATLSGCSFIHSSQYAAAPESGQSTGYFVDPLSGARYRVAMPQTLEARNLPPLKVAATTRESMLLFSPAKTVTDAPQALALASRVETRATGRRLPAGNTTEEIAPLRLDHSFGAITRMVPFAVNRASLGPIGRKAVSELVPIVKEARHVFVRGRTDASGDASVNETLATQRARTVASAFVAAGVRSAKITGSQCIDCFVASNATDDGRRMNRRVDVEMQLPKARIAQLPRPVYALATPSLLLAKTLTYPRQ